MKKLIRFLVPLLLIIVIIASIGWYLFVYDRDFTRDFLLSQARYNDLYGNSRLSSWFYDLAYEHTGRDENVAIELANQYKSDGNYTKAEYTLSNALNNGGTVELYTALCKTYVEQDKLLDAVAMLETISDPNMKAQLDALRPSAPEANYEPGFYTQYINVELTSSSGTLYYTTDGEYPSIAREPYSSPVEMPAGETTVYAISVDDSGLVSPVTIVGYTIGGVIEPITFQDKTMETAIREAIGANSSDILYTNELWALTEFTVPEGVQSYDDLEYMLYLKKLTIQDQSLDSLSCLASMSKLETLDLSGCDFPAEELKVIANLPALTHLTLSNCGLTTIAELEGAPNLTYLDLSDNGGLRKLDALSNIYSLTELNLSANAIVDLSSLSKLNNLEKLDVSHNALPSVNGIATCTKLNWLNADYNQLTSINGLESLPLLSYLSLDYNQLNSAYILGQCTELTNLSISNNQFTDISALGNLVKLDILDFSYNSVAQLPAWRDGCALRTIDGSYNQLQSIDSLNTLDQISYVYMDYNKLTSVDALAECYHMVQVNVFGNSISDVSKLTAHNIIVNYDPTQK